MLKSASALVATLLLATAGFASTASAANFSPNPVSSVNLTGVLTLRQTTTVNCNSSFTGSIASGGASGSISSGSFGPGVDFACGLFVFPSGFSWTITPSTSGGVDYVTITGIGATSIAGSCSGSITGVWDDATHSVTFNNAVIGGSPSNCYVTGTLTADQALTIVP